MGANAIYRVTFALSIFHFLSALATIGVKRSDDSRAEFQNSMLWFYLAYASRITPNFLFRFLGAEDSRTDRAGGCCLLNSERVLPRLGICGDARCWRFHSLPTRTVLFPLSVESQLYMLLLLT